jgi:MinD-like ATPase involved in chromosome partitioning or flagellar assembly
VVTLGLASMIAGSGVSTMVVDVDVYGGSQAQMLGLLDESSGLLAAARAANRGRLDRDQLAAHARAVSPTMRVLSGLPRSDRWVELSPVLLRRILETARSLCALTLLDCGFCVELDEEVSYDISAPRRNGATLTALTHADLVVVVGSADPVGLGRLLRALADLRVQAPDVAPRVVVNRMRPSLGWSGDDVAAMVSRTAQLEVEAFLPDDPAACDRAIVQGQTLRECAAGSKLTKALDRLAESLAADLGLPVAAAAAHRAT